uniref:Spliceosome-associated protein CWC15 homolog n=1 Tax=Phallusia mammillata TaxID=59560 RepID=A0A6F9DA39_9ASCI|nr:spliceosome-associated protein CWC15 homolog [Phallusia mammillata]
MSTAHRATFAPAKGGTARGESDLGKLSKQYSSRDLPSHTKLKYRQTGQNAPDDIRSRDLRIELDERERSSRGDKRSFDSRQSRDSQKKQRLDQVSAANLDADDPIDSDSDDSNDSEDDTAELLAELNRIKKERAEETAKLEQERKEEQERIRTENILSGNPLLTGSSNQNFAVKRRWDDDVVFKNCARGESDKLKQHFVNDTLRSEFHKKFMDKYVK